MPKKQHFTPLWQKIRDDYLEKIKNRTLLSGQLLPTEKMIADEYNVSRITVVRAMNELAELGYIIRRRGSGSVVNYNPKKNNESNIYTQTKTIALIMPVSATRDYRVLNEIDRISRENGYIVSLYDSGKSIAKERDILKNLININVSGIISFPIQSIENIDSYFSVCNSGIPLVFIDRTLPGLNVPCVKANNFLGGKIITEHLLKKGHRNICFFCYNRALFSESERFNGYINALLEYNISPKSDYIIELFSNMPEDSMLFSNVAEENTLIRKQLYKIQHLTEPPTAIFCINDDAAIKVQQQALSLGINIPKDLSIVGFDNSEHFMNTTSYITTCAQDFEKIGSNAISLILAMINKEPLPFFEDVPVEVVERQSVAEI